MRHRSRLLIALLLALPGVGWSRAVHADEPAAPGGAGQSSASPVPPSVPIPAVLTLDEALRILRARGLDLLIADANLRTAESNVQSAAAIANPGVSFSTGPTFNTSATASSSRESIGWGINDNAVIVDELAGKRGLRVAVARAALAAARLSRADAQRNLEFQVKQQYAQIALAAETLDLTREIQKSLEGTLAASHAQYPRMIDEGALSRIEVQKLEGDQAVSSAILALRQAKIGLAFLLGARDVAPDFEVERDTLKFRVPAALEGATPASLLRRALELRPDVAALGYQRLRADASFELARRQQLPAVQLGVQYTSIGLGQNALGVPTLTGQAQANIPVFYQQQGEVRRARADLATQGLRYAKSLAQVASDVEMAFATFKGNRELVERMEATLLGRAKTAFTVVEKQYRGGNLKLNDFLDAYRTNIATRIEHLQGLAAYWTAVYQLEQASGAELRR
jgi:outer membrane protein, heavy metal efflux system